jgi:hypothetical protein
MRKPSSQQGHTIITRINELSPVDESWDMELINLIFNNEDACIIERITHREVCKMC